jgi:hypothetical protein
MGKYSRADLLKDELSLIGAKDFLGLVFKQINKTSTVLLTIEVPKNLYFRAEILCDDIEELSGMAFIQNDLMNLLYNDFLIYAKKNPDPRAIFNLLSSLEPSGKDTQLLQQGENVYKMVTQESKQEMIALHLRMRRKVALRGEVLLADMEEVQPQHGYTLERIFELLYIDFIDKFRKGNSADAINNIIKLLDN